MHFLKTYAQLLLSLPPELCENAIQYRQADHSCRVTSTPGARSSSCTSRAEAEVFEGVHEADRGEHSVEESENHLKLFAERVTSRGLGDDRQLKGKSSCDALKTFLALNMFILNIRKFQFANAEATRKILKKHTKRTSLPFLSDDLSSQAMVLPNRNTAKLPCILVQAIGETLLPIILHLDDYSCLIGTSIAFEPICLSCGHLFCVRCLVKMQKRGQGRCPMCKEACLPLIADWALLNFMQAGVMRAHCAISVSLTRIASNVLSTTRSLLDVLDTAGQEQYGYVLSKWSFIA
ncbi:hypothetical protein H0H92_004353 [Tricholoma furcatifolium]|nr:hypothetical protein H0H92_004353 [Tricholoma furcatifolium]